jgi:uncharacterized protein
MATETLTPQPNPYLGLVQDRGVGEEQVKAVKTFTIPVSGSVVLFGPEIDIIKSPEFQRLAGIRQLGTSYVVFRGALHTRFEHSLGSLHQAELMLRAIENNPIQPQRIDPQERRLARLGALLHDLPHVPFGHTLEDEFHLLRRHDENPYRKRQLLETRSVPRILRRVIGSTEFDLLVAILNVKKDADFAKLGRLAFVADMVGNTVCADLLDYVQRDCLACGLPMAVGERFLDYLSITSPNEARTMDQNRLVLNLDKKAMPRPDVESEVVKLMSYRYELAERVYFHHSKNAASVMIGRAVQEAGWATGVESANSLDKNFHWLSDELLLRCLKDPAMEQAQGIVPDPVAVGDRALASELASLVLIRDLYKIAYLAVADDVASGIGRIYDEYGRDPATRRQLEDRFADQAGIPRGKVLVHILRQKMVSKDADVRVRTDRGDVVKLAEWDRSHSRRMDALNQAHERLWRVLVYVHPDKTHESAIEIVRAAAQDEFGAASRYVPRSKIGRYERVLFDRLAEEWTLRPSDLEALEKSAYAPGLSDQRKQTEEGIRSFVQAHRAAEGAAPLRRRAKTD